MFSTILWLLVPICLMNTSSYLHHVYAKYLWWACDDFNVCLGQSLLKEVVLGLANPFPHFIVFMKIRRRMNIIEEWMKWKMVHSRHSLFLPQVAWVQNERNVTNSWHNSFLKRHMSIIHMSWRISDDAYDFLFCEHRWFHYVEIWPGWITNCPLDVGFGIIESQNYCQFR